MVRPLGSRSKPKSHSRFGRPGPGHLPCPDGSVIARAYPADKGALRVRRARHQRGCLVIDSDMVWVELDGNVHIIYVWDTVPGVYLPR